MDSSAAASHSTRPHRTLRKRNTTNNFNVERINNYVVESSNTRVTCFFGVKLETNPVTIMGEDKLNEEILGALSDEYTQLMHERNKLLRLGGVKDSVGECYTNKVQYDEKLKRIYPRIQKLEHLLTHNH